MMITRVASNYEHLSQGAIKKTCHEVIRGTRLTLIYFHQPRRRLQGPRVRAWRFGTSGVGGQSMPQKLGPGMVFQRFCAQGMRQVQYIAI